jgi:hypothetical protein
MSDNWAHYVANIGGHSGSIVYDEGLAGLIQTLPQDQSVMITAQLRDAMDNGLPTDAEAERLNILQDQLDALFETVGGLTVGRITYNGQRHHFYYTQGFPKVLSEEVSVVGEANGYVLTSGAKEDPAKSVYFEELYATGEDRQVLLDMQVIRALIDHNDDLSAPREVDYLSIFPKKSAAEAYVGWALGQGYRVDPIRKTGGFLNRAFEVESHNQTAVTVQAINPHSLGHFRQAIALGGAFDGWGCGVVPLPE